MADSWESALSYARGEYVILLGADDALLPSTLFVLDHLTEHFHGKVISWPTAHYHWPSSPALSKRNILQLPLGAFAKEKNGHEMLQKVVKFQVGYEMLPMFYNSCVRRELLEDLRSRTGRVIHASNPDVATGMAFAAVAGNYLRLAFPLSIAGVSGASNGGAATVARQSGVLKASSTWGEFCKMNPVAGFGTHASLPDIPLVAVWVADAFIKVQAATGQPSSVRLCRRSLMKQCFREAAGFAEPMRSELEEALCKYFGKSASGLASNKNVGGPLEGKMPLGYQPRSHALNVDLCSFNVTDVYGAAIHCDHLVNPRSLIADNPCLLADSATFGKRLKQAVKILLGVEQADWF
jgi:hypothetical protein